MSTKAPRSGERAQRGRTPALLVYTAQELVPAPARAKDNEVLLSPRDGHAKVASPAGTAGTDDGERGCAGHASRGGGVRAEHQGVASSQREGSGYATDWASAGQGRARPACAGGGYMTGLWTRGFGGRAGELGQRGRAAAGGTGSLVTGAPLMRRHWGRHRAFTDDAPLFDSSRAFFCCCVRGACFFFFLRAARWDGGRRAGSARA